MGPKKHTNVWTNPKINTSKCGWVLHSLKYLLYFPSSIRNLNHLAKLHCDGLYPFTLLVWAHYKRTFSHLSCFYQRAASNRLSGAPTERLQARIWSKKWGLSDGGEQGLWQRIKRKGEVKVYDWAGGGAAKCMPVTRRPTETQSLTGHAVLRKLFMYIILISLSVWGGRGGRGGRALSSPLCAQSSSQSKPKIRPPRWDEGSFILLLIVTNETRRWAPSIWKPVALSYRQMPFERSNLPCQ